ncbi:MAG: hypothetical protein H6553_13700 [Chitinophagales bacterium]|nr:hypothetical protein [Chitinophagales bacterium]
MLYKYLTLLLNIPLLLIGFFLLNRSAGFFVDGASSIARKIKLPESMISFTIVALGASLPKLFTNILAVMNGYDDLVIGNVIGSNIFNLLGIIGIVGLYRPIRANRYTLFIGIPFSILSVVLLYLLSNNILFGTKSIVLGLSNFDGYILLIGFIGFMTYGYFNVKKHNAIWFEESHQKIEHYAIWFAVLMFIIGLIGLYAGAILVVDNLIDISRKYHLSQRFLGQFVLALGGSFTMLWWTLNFKTHQSKFEVSSLIGTNVLNIFGMLGVCAVIAPMAYNTSFNIDIYILIAISILLMLFLWTGKKLNLSLAKCRFLVLLLIVYMVYLFVR